MLDLLGAIVGALILAGVVGTLWLANKGDPLRQLTPEMKARVLSVVASRAISGARITPATDEEQLRYDDRGGFNGGGRSTVFAVRGTGPGGNPEKVLCRVRMPAGLFGAQSGFQILEQGIWTDEG